MVDPEGVGRIFAMYTAGVMLSLSHQSGESVAWAGTFIHGRDGSASYRVVVHHCAGSVALCILENKY